MTLVTIRLFIPLLKRPLIQLFETKRTLKMFWMKLLKHGRDAPTRNGFVTPRTEWPSEGMVVILTIGSPFVFEEVSSREWLPARRTHEAARMPLAVQWGDVIFFDRALAAHAFRGESLQETRGAKGFRVSVVEAARAEVRVAGETHEAFWVPERERKGKQNWVNLEKISHFKGFFNLLNFNVYKMSQKSNVM